MEALNQTQQQDINNRIRAEKQRRQQAGEPPLSPAEEHEMRSGYMNDVAASGAAEDRTSQVGNIKTTPERGSTIVGGPYKGMTPQAAARAAYTGQVPVKGGRPGQIGNGLLDEFYAKNPHLDRNRRSTVDFVTGKGQTTSPTASSAINTASPWAFVTGMSQAAYDKARQAKVASETNAAMAQGIHDGKNNVLERGPRSVIWNNGATVQTGASGNKTLTSPYGGGSSRLVHPVTPAQATTPQLAAPQPSTASRQVQAVLNDQQGPPTPGASTVIGRLNAGLPPLPAPGSPNSRPSPIIDAAVASRTDPLARTANTMQPPQGPLRPSPLVTGPSVNPSTVAPRTDATPMAPGDRAKIASIAGDRGLWYRNVWPAVTGQFSTESKAAPILEKYGVSVPTQYPNPAARVAGDNEAVLGLEKQGVLTGKTTKDAGGVPHKSVTVHTPQTLIPKAQPGSMQQRTMTPPRNSPLVTPIRL